MSNGFDGIENVGTSGPTSVRRFTSIHSSRASSVATSSSPDPAVVLSIAALVIDCSTARPKLSYCPVGLRSTVNHRPNRLDASSYDSCISTAVTDSVSDRRADSTRSMNPGPNDSRRCDCANRLSSPRSSTPRPAYGPSDTASPAPSA